MHLSFRSRLEPDEHRTGPQALAAQDLRPLLASALPLSPPLADFP